MSLLFNQTCLNEELPSVCARVCVRERERERERLTGEREREREREIKLFVLDGL